MAHDPELGSVSQRQHADRESIHRATPRRLGRTHADIAENKGALPRLPVGRDGLDPLHALLFIGFPIGGICPEGEPTEHDCAELLVRPIKTTLRAIPLTNQTILPIRQRATLHVLRSERQSRRPTAPRPARGG